MEPMLTAAQARIPVVDGDGMGRAFPEMRMCTWSVYGHTSTPSAMADEKGNVVILAKTRDEVWVETPARANVVAMGAAAAVAMAPMKGAYVKTAAVPHTITQALSLGRAVIGAHKASTDPIAAVLALPCHPLLRTEKAPHNGP